MIHPDSFARFARPPDHDQANVSRGVARASPPLAREEYFITTKCPPATLAAARKCVADNLAELDAPYVDLLLVHWPASAHGEPDALTLQTWRAVQEAWEAGTARAIGVSSFLQADLELVNEAGAPFPEVNQASMSIGEHDDETIAYCTSQGIVYESYSPLRKGDVLEYPEVNAIADAHGVSAAQVALKWIVQQQIPLATSVVDEDYMKEDLDLWSWGKLTDGEMATLSAI